MADVISASSSKLQSVNNLLDDHAQNIHKTHQKMDDLLDNLQRDGWHSPAADHFYIEMRDRLQQSMMRLELAFRNASQKCNEIGTLMEKADVEASEFIRTI